MMNITKTLNEYLLENVLTDYEDIIYNDIFPTEEGECLISRHDPSQAKETEYLDGSAKGSWSIAYYFRSANPEGCRNLLLSIANGLDNIQLIDTDGTEIEVEAKTLPAFVSVDDKNSAIYTVEITARYLRTAQI